MLNFKKTYFEEHLPTTASDTLRGVIELVLKDFVILLNVYEFLKFSTLDSMVIHHEICDFIVHDSAGMERNNF